MADQNKWPVLNSYVEGNTVRKLDYYEYETETSPRKADPVKAEPARKTAPRKKASPKKAVKTAVQPKVYRQPKERFSDMTVVFAGVTAVCVAAIMACGLQFVNAKTMLATSAKTLVNLENELKQVNSDNKKLAAVIDAGLDLEYIYQVATEEFGYVASDDSQVIYYNEAESGYVIQNELIR